MRNERLKGKKIAGTQTEHIKAMERTKCAQKINVDCVRWIWEHATESEW